MDALFFRGTTLPDIWFQLVYALMKGEVPRNVYKIDKGSYVGQQRLEFPYVTVQIDNPGAEPTIPFMPEGSNLPPPVEDMDYVRDYFTSYLMNTEVADNETYIYGTWLAPGVERVIEQLRDSPGNNQAAISIGGLAPWDHPMEEAFFHPDGKKWQKEVIDKKPDVCIDTDNFIDPGTGQRDPACLRLVDFRYDQHNTLHMVVYFRCLAEDEHLFFSDKYGPRLGTVGDVFTAWQANCEPYVVGVHEETGEHCFVPIEDAARRYAENIFAVTLIDGSRLSVTPEHHVVVLQDDGLVLKQARDLQIGDQLVRAGNFPQLDGDDSLLPAVVALVNGDREYYLRDIPLPVFSGLRKIGVSVKESWRDKRVLPLRFLDDVKGVCKHAGHTYVPIVGSARSPATWLVDLKANWEWGYLIGAWLANGWTRSNALRIATGQSRVIERLYSILDTLGVHYATYEQDNCEVFNISDVFVRDVLTLWGLSGHAHTKHVPDAAFQFSADVRQGIFEGWFEGDAGGSVSEELVAGMQCLALSIGVISSVYTEPPRKVSFPDGREVVSSVSYRLHPTSGERHSYSPAPFAENRLIFSKIKEISSIYRAGWVVDFTVADTHNLFVGRGNVLVHNSWDLWGGFPANLAGLQLVKEYVAQAIGAEDGKIIAASKGLHIYDHCIDIAAQRLGITDVGSMDELLEYIKAQL